MRWNKTKDGWSVMVVDSKKMYDIVYEDVVRQNEKKNEEIAAKMSKILRELNESLEEKKRINEQYFNVL